MAYKLIIPKPVAKNFKSFPENDKRRIFKKLVLIEKNPYLTGNQKLVSFKDQYRVRAGEYRIRYLINNMVNEVVILDIAHRKDIYKKK